MSKRICKDCGSIDIRTTKYSHGGKCYVCGDCSRVGLSDAFPEYTVFHQITQSPETLAETLVYCEQPEYQYSCASWRSVVLGSVAYARKSEAIAATIEKLKGACNA